MAHDHLLYVSRAELHRRLDCDNCSRSASSRKANNRPENGYHTFVLLFMRLFRFINGKQNENTLADSEFFSRSATSSPDFDTFSFLILKLWNHFKASSHFVNWKTK